MTHKEKVIDSAERTIRKYKEELGHAESYSEISDDFNFGTNESCFYCKNFYIKGINFEESSCGDCPMAILCKAGCSQFEDYDVIEDIFDKSSFDDYLDDYDISEYIAALKSRIGFHERILKEGKLSDYDIKRSKQHMLKNHE